MCILYSRKGNVVFWSDNVRHIRTQVCGVCGRVRLQEIEGGKRGALYKNVKEAWDWCACDDSARQEDVEEYIAAADVGARGDVVPTGPLFEAEDGE